MGVAFLLYGIAFFMCWLALGFSAVGKMCAPLIGVEEFSLSGRVGSVPIEFVLVPIIALVVTIYGVMGGLRAAYWTDLIQGVFIIVLSVLLIPVGLDALVEKFGDPQTMGTLGGFQVMHERVSADYFQIFATPRAGEFPFHYIVALTVLALVGIVVQPHFIAIGGGSAKTEMAAKVGLVGGVFMKRLCSVGWALTALIVLALMADNLEIAEDPDAVWGVAAREILGPFQIGLVGLMLACLLAALMSSADCYMLIVSALVVRNFYAAYVRREADEKECVLVGRIVGVVIIAGAAAISLYLWDIFRQFKIALELPIIFAAPFWVGMFWRRATRLAAWLTLGFSLTVFFFIPYLAPVVMPDLRADSRFAITTDMVTAKTMRKATAADAAKRGADIPAWEAAQKKLGPRPTPLKEGELFTEATTKTQRPATAGDIAEREAAVAVWEYKRWKLGPRPEPIKLGDPFTDTFKTGGDPIFWTGTLEPIGKWEIKQVARDVAGQTEKVTERLVGEFRGEGHLNLDFLIYQWMGMDLKQCSKATLETLRLPTRLVLPFVVMILLSLVTPRGNKEVLDRYYVKMKTPVDPDPEADAAELELSYSDPSRFDHQRLFPSWGLEIQKPKLLDVIGFVAAFAVCFAIIGLTVWLANLGR
jgi:SSS family solute:Na+ symporter